MKRGCPFSDKSLNRKIPGLYSISWYYIDDPATAIWLRHQETWKTSWYQWWLQANSIQISFCRYGGSLHFTHLALSFPPYLPPIFRNRLQNMARPGRLKSATICHVTSCLSSLARWLHSIGCRVSASVLQSSESDGEMSARKLCQGLNFFLDIILF